MEQDLLMGLLERFKLESGRAFRLYILNTGGTISCILNENGLLSPIQSGAELESLVKKTMRLEVFVESGMLELTLDHLFAMDSSQIQTSDREEIVKLLKKNYSSYDGALILHGTDTGTDTAKFIALALPYYNPIDIWRNYRDGKNPDLKNAVNFSTPVIVVSSQIPIPSFNTKFRMYSDGPMNFYVSIMALIEGRLSGAGYISNNTSILNGCVSTKTSEINIPPYQSDGSVAPAATFTAIGLRYANIPNEEKRDMKKQPVVALTCSSVFESKVALVYDSSNLSSIRYFVEAKKRGENEVGRFLCERLPEIIIYVSKGAGNVAKHDYELLKEAELHGGIVFRVPIPGGRIPSQQMYDVPGFSFQAINMQPITAFYKALMALSLFHESKEPKEKKKEFIEYMMKVPWGNEILRS